MSDSVASPLRMRSPATRLLARLQVVLLLTIVLLPIAWMLLASFKKRVDVMSLPHKLFSVDTLDNYR